MVVEGRGGSQKGSELIVGGVWWAVGWQLSVAV